LRNKFISILNRDYVKKDELISILKELQLQREESNKRFENMEKRFDKVLEKLDELSQVLENRS